MSDSQVSTVHADPDALQGEGGVVALHDRERDPGYFGWRVLLGAVVGLAFSPGPVSLLFVGTMAPTYAQRMGASMGQVMFGLTVLNLASIVSAPFVGRLIDRRGPRTALFGSIAIMALCLLAWGYLARTLLQFYAVAAAFGLLTVGAQSLTYNKFLAGWFDRHRGVAMGIASSGLGLGYSILPLIIGSGLKHLGPGGTTLMLAIILLLLPLGLNLLVARERQLPAVTPGPVQSGPLAGMELSEVVRQRAFWLLSIAIFLMSMVATGLVPQFMKLGQDLGYSVSSAAQVASIFGLATLAGRLVVGWLFDRYFAPLTACAFFLIAAAGYGIAALTIHSSLGWHVLAVSAVLMGLGFGAESDLIGYLASRYFGLRRFGAIYGLLLSIFVLGAALGPLFYGLLRDVSGGYGMVFGISAVVAAIASATLSALPRFPE